MVAITRAEAKIFFGVFVVGATFLPVSALAQNVTGWATWVIPETYDYTFSGDGSENWSRGSDFAAGTTGSAIDPQTGETIDMILSGEVAYWSDYTGYFTGSTFESEVTGVAPGSTTQIAQSGFTEPEYQAHTLQFSEPVTNAVMLIDSLGSPSTEGGFIFSQPFVILSENAAGFTATGDSATGYQLTGNEADGIIQFLGTYDSISWIASPPEAAAYFTVGLTTPDNPSAGETVATYDLFGAGGVTEPTSFGSFSSSGADTGNSSLLASLLADADVLSASLTNLAENQSGLDASVSMVSSRKYDELRAIVNALSAGTGSLASVGADVFARDVALPDLSVLMPSLLTVEDISTTAIGAMQSGDIQASFDATSLLSMTNDTAAQISVTHQIYGSVDGALAVQNVAYNLGTALAETSTLINASVTMTLNDVNARAGSIATTSIGAMQSGNIEAQLLGRLVGG